MRDLTIWHAVALVFIVEGLLPFVSPTGWRGLFKQLLELSDGQIRFFGLCSIATGLFAWFVIDWLS